MQSKYEALQIFLQGKYLSTKHISLSFYQLEEIMGSKLPKSAYECRQWWANQIVSNARPQAKAWLSAKYEVETVQQNLKSGAVTFRRIQKYRGCSQRNGHRSDPRFRKNFYVLLQTSPRIGTSISLKFLDVHLEKISRDYSGLFKGKTLPLYFQFLETLAPVRTLPSSCTIRTGSPFSNVTVINPQLRISAFAALTEKSRANVKGNKVARGMFIFCVSNPCVQGERKVLPNQRAVSCQLLAVQPELLGIRLFQIAT